MFETALLILLLFACLVGVDLGIRIIIWLINDIKDSYGYDREEGFYDD